MIRPTSLVSACLILALAGTALADGTVRMSAGASGLGGGNGGGAFTATYDSGYIGEFSGPGSTANSFQTFCLQLSESVSLGNSLYNAAVRSYTVAAGNSSWDPVTGLTGTAVQDEISATTALLYSTFRSGGNFGGNFTGAYDGALATALQLAIWYSEGELANANAILDNQRYSSFTGSALATDLASSDTLAEQLFFWAKGLAVLNPNEFYGVQVLVLSNGPGQNGFGNNQDMLTIVPLPPAAYAGMGTLAGVIGLGYIRRRRLAGT